MKASLALVLMLTAALYARHVATAGWVYEDSNAVMANGAVTGAQPIQIDRARWLSALSHRLVWTAAGNHPAAHHAVNLALHLGNGVLVSAVAGVFLPPVAAWGAATLFLVHPVQTEAVAYVASRSELLATTFALLAGLIALHADRGWHYVAVVGAVALAVCAKESAAVIVPILAVSDLFRGRRLSAWRYGACLVPVGLIAVSVLAQDYTARSELGGLAYAATQATAVWRYLGLVVVPIGFSVDHGFEMTPWIVRWTALAALIALALVTILAGVSAGDGETRTTGRLWDSWPALRVAAFGVTWLLVALAPRFVMRIPELLNEHQTYLPFVGVWIALAALVHATVQKGPDGLSTAR